jgi:acetyltransferase-like isoleucine patch superfamily enzyme
MTEATRRRKSRSPFAPGGWVWGLKNRVLQILARYAPGASNVRVWMHRQRGVHIGEGCFISTDALIETSKPHLVWIGDRVDIGVRAMLLAHFRGGIKADRKEFDADAVSIRIEDDVTIGAGAIVLRNVTVGKGAVVTAGSVVSRSVPPMTMVSGNPAKPVARCGISMSQAGSIWEFYKHLRPLGGERSSSSATQPKGTT